MTASACRCPIAASAEVSRWLIAARSATPTSWAVSRGVQAEFSQIMEPAGLGGVPVETGLGRWAHGPCGILLTTVTGVKRGAQDWLGVDASRADLLRPELYGTYHHISVLGDDRVEGRRRYAVGDRIPEPREPFGQRLLRNAAEARVLSSMTSGPTARPWAIPMV